MRPIRARKPLPLVGKKCAVGAGGSGLACCTLLLGLKGPTLLCCVGSFCDEVAPAGSVGGKRFPGLSADVEAFLGIKNYKNVDDLKFDF